MPTSRLADPQTAAAAAPHLHEPLAAAAALPRPDRRAGRLRLALLVELMHLVEAAFGSKDALEHDPRERHAGRAPRRSRRRRETLDRCCVVLGLIDVVMISNLLIMVIVGGYETFVSRMRPRGPSRPAGMAVARQRERAQGEARDRDHRHLVDPPAEDVHQRAGVRRRRRCSAQTAIHITFLLSALAIAAVDRIMPQAARAAREPRRARRRALTGALP